MRNLTFTVTIKFADNINNDLEIQEVAQNIATGLIEQANHEGLSPENSETYTKSIKVSKDGELLDERYLVL